MDTIHILICKKYKTASENCGKARSARMAINYRGRSRGEREGSREWCRYESLRFEATIWNIIACIAKCQQGQGKSLHPAIHAPKALRDQYHHTANCRLNELIDWAERHPQAAESLAAPLRAEYAERAKQRGAAV